MNRHNEDVINNSINCTRVGEQFRHERCDRYWRCTSTNPSRAVLRLCPHRQLFDVDFQQCMNRKNANCKDEPFTTTTRRPEMSSTTNRTSTTRRPPPINDPSQLSTILPNFIV
ncbi:hypothetical protein RDWZM_010013 [Blomia tropicalis]|uniref:Chitin-binding type-2 domain-containing protein n=1 Tax=Blomia tropicalis TaxID=40697 RepID=A0A9Q0RHB2_BLOTA|nr:hypothetical protein RDWZM_010013 [Blomia tropicalis]